jgi:hypothetical protein
MEVNAAKKRIENKNSCVMLFGWHVKNHWVVFDLD